MSRVLLADDLAALPLIRQAERALGWSWDVVVAPVDQHADWAPLGARVTPAQAASLWQTSRPEKVLLAGTSSEITSLAALAALHGASLFVLPDAHQTADWAYHLFPLAEDAGDRLIPVFLHRHDPAARALRDLVVSGALGDGLHLICEASLPGDPVADLDVDRRFLLDADFFRWLAGEYDSLTAVPVPAPTGGVVTETITLAGEGRPTVIWSVRGGGFGWRLSARGSKRQANLTQSADGAFQLETSDVPSPSLSTAAPASWRDLMRAFDYVAASRRSIRRRRTVDLQVETLTEAAQFKSLMSTTGCGLLLFTLFGVIALLVGGAALDPRDSLQRASETSGLVFLADDFVDGEDQLTEESQHRLVSAAPRMLYSVAPVLLEQLEPPSQPLNAARKASVVARLAEKGVASPESRVEVRPIVGRWFSRVLTLAWIVLFLPLGIFLAAQAFVLLARGPRGEEPAPPS